MSTELSDFDVWMSKGLMARQSGELLEALSAFEEAHLVSPENSNCCTAIGGVYRELGRFEEAWPFLLKAVELNPKSQFGWHECGIASGAEGDTLGALEFYLSAVRNLPNERHLTQLARALGEAGYFVLAKEAAEKLIRENKLNAAAWDVLLRTAMYQESVHLIVETAKGFLAEFPDRIDVRIILANELIKEKRWAEATRENELIQNSGRADFYVEGRKQAIKWGKQKEASTSGATPPPQNDMGSSIPDSQPKTTAAQYFALGELNAKDTRSLGVALSYAGNHDLALQAAWAYGNRSDVKLHGKSADFLLNATVFSRYPRPGNLRSLRQTNVDGFSPIPKKIAQFWDKELPPDVADITRSWIEQNPDHSYRLYNDVEAKQFISLNFGEYFAELYDYSHHPAMRADLFRLCVIYIEGGIYSDADDICFVPVDTWLRNQDTDIIVTFSSGPRTYLHNWFFAAVPRHDFILHTLNRAFANVERVRALGRKADIWEDTGPGCLSRSFFEWFCKKPFRDSIATELPRMCFLPERAFRQLTRWKRDLKYRKTLANWRRA